MGHIESPRAAAITHELQHFILPIAFSLLFVGTSLTAALAPSPAQGQEPGHDPTPTPQRLCGPTIKDLCDSTIFFPLLNRDPNLQPQP